MEQMQALLFSQALIILQSHPAICFYIYQRKNNCLKIQPKHSLYKLGNLFERKVQCCHFECSVFQSCGKNDLSFMVAIWKDCCHFCLHFVCLVGSVYFLAKAHAFCVLERVVEQCLKRRNVVPTLYSCPRNINDTFFPKVLSIK